MFFEVGQYKGGTYDQRVHLVFNLLNVIHVIYVMFVFVWSAGLDKVEFLQSHENHEIYQKAFDIIERYFGTEDDVKAIAPQIDADAQQYQFNVGENAPGGGFQF